MAMFIIVGLAGGFLFAGSISLFFNFQFDHLEKYSTGVWALVGFVCVIVMVAIAFPLSDFCVSQILKVDPKPALGHLRLVWAVPLLMSEYYWIDKIAKKRQALKGK